MGKKKAKNETGSAGATPALQILNTAGVPYRLIEYEHSDVMEHGFALDTASVLHLNPRTVFKTLLVETDSKNAAVGIVPASAMLNLKSIAKALHVKHAEMMDPIKAERITGYIKGGISPIGQKRKLPTIIDTSACNHDQILVSGGKRNLSVAIAPQILAQLIDAEFAQIAQEK